jgi:hypothetical protein
MTRRGLYVTATGPRANEWREVFGDDRVPVTSLDPVKTDLEGLGTREAYMLDVSRLEPGQLESLVSHLAKRFPEDSPDGIRAEIIARGFPIQVNENLLRPTIDFRFIV